MKQLNVNRTLPVNFNDRDKKLFLHELAIKIKKPQIIKRRNIYILDVELKKFKHFKYHYQHWKLKNPSLTWKTKTFIKDLLNVLFSKNFDYSLEVIEKGIWITNEKSNRYFHWMLDAGQRIQLCIENINEQDLLNYKFLIPKKYFENDFVKSFIDIYKIKYTLLEDGKLYKIKDLIIPFHLAPSGNYNPHVVKEMRSTFHNSYKQIITQNNEKKIWISRQSSRIRKIKNFYEVEKILKNNGFNIVDFDNKNFSEQIKIVMNAEVIGGLHGGGLSSMLFLKQGKKIIEIRGRNDKFNNCYFSLASALNLEYYYFLASVEDEDFYHNDYEIDEEKFSSFFNTYFC